MPLIQWITRRIVSFRYAFAGIGYVIRTQSNAWIHALATVCVVIMGLWLELARLDWVLLVIVMGSVWAAEIMNSAVEAVVDLVSPDAHPLAKAAKDCAAGAVLITAITAALVGFLVLGPPLWAKIY